MSDQLLVGVDLGGTNVRAALVRRDGVVLQRDKRDSLQERDPDDTLGAIVETCRAVMEAEGVSAADVLGVGIGMPGIMDGVTGVCHWSPNFPSWKDVPVGPHVRAELGVPTFILNDAKCAILGEWEFGAGRGTRDLVMITLGTGIGGAFIVDGRLLVGPDGSIGEVGHHTVHPFGRRCGCGNYGCWEAMCARDAIRECAERQLQSGRESVLAALPRHEITPRDVAEAALQQDPVALAAMEEIGFYIGLGVANLINMMNPERFIVGGGIATAGEVLFGPLRRTVHARAVPLQAGRVTIVPADLGDDAGVLGAAVLVLARLGERHGVL